MPLTLQFSRPAAGAISLGRIRTTMIGDLARSLIRSGPSSGRSSNVAGIALTREPISSSDGRSGSNEPSRSTRTSRPQIVCAFRSPGSGPRSRRMTTAGSGSSTIAPINELRMSLRRPNPLSSVPSSKSESDAARTSSALRNSWRSWITSGLDMSFLAQWIAPAPIRNKAPPSVRPRARLELRTASSDAEAARVGLLLDRLEEGDDLALLIRVEGVVVEDRHRLGSGDHGLVDVPGLDAGEVGRALAVCQCTALAGGVVAGGAVRAEQLTAARDVARGQVPGGGRVVVRGLGPGREGGDERGELLDLLVRVRDLLLLCLSARRRHGHSPGADLEVDGGGAHADQRWAEHGAVVS